MGWGIRKQHAAAPSAQCVREDDRERGGKGKGGRAFSFSPLSWLGKLTGREKPAGAVANKHAAAVAATAPSCLPKRTSPIAALPSSPPRRSPDDADVVPRRLSVGNDNVDAARRRSLHRRRHCSLGGDRELLPLGHLIPFSLTGSPALPPQSAAVVPSDTDAGPAPRTNKRRRCLSNGGTRSGRRPSFSGRTTVPLRGARTARVRSPRRAPELERLAVVRRTRDPQRAFRESMVEMVASSGGRPEELERLLACYLSLNADEHHGVIVKVFRQVWFEYVNLLRRPDARRRR
jgi:uncharacterized protein (TIGR01568 family)